MAAFKITIILLVAMFAQAQSQGLNLNSIKLPSYQPTSDSIIDQLTREAREAFPAFLKQYYDGTPIGYNFGERLKIFIQNFITVALNNLNENSSYVLEINKFADKTVSELQLGNGIDASLIKPLNSIIFSNTSNASDLPKSWNWTEKGAVTPVKDQGACGSCWAFAATGALEGMLAINGKSMGQLSDQNILDCMSAESGYTCANGGWTETALDWVKTNGVSKTACYTYKAKEGTCIREKDNSACQGIAPNQVQGHVAAKPTDINSLKTILIKYGPVAISFYASPDLSFYKGGIWGNPLTCNQAVYGVNHAVLITGYGTDPLLGDYWIVKNQWGTSWGEQGYFKIAMANDICGVTNYAVVPYLNL